MNMYVLAIIGLILAGAVVGTLLAFTMAWVTERVKIAFARRRAKKVLIISARKLAEECPNQMSLAELEKLSNGHRSYVVAEINQQGDISKTDFINDSNDTLDEDVARILGREEEAVISQ